MKKLLSLILVLCLVGSSVVFASASDQGCSSSGDTASGCGGTTNNGGNGGNGGSGGSGGQGGSGGNASVGNVTNTIGNITNTANGGSVGDISNSGGSTEVSNELDASDSSKYYSYSAPSVSPAIGTEVISLQSIFGGISVANTEDYAVQLAELEALARLVEVGILTKEEARVEALRSVKRLHWSSRPKRLLGVGPKSRGKHIVNLFGLLATDSYRDEK